MAPKKAKKLNIALQGGGAHGAFAWGVLDKLLEDGRIDFDGICATSAGSLNAAGIAYGLTIDGRDGARQALHDIWSKVSELGNIYSPIKRMPWEYIPGLDTPYEEAASFSVFEIFTNAFSPYQFNPLNINPLRQVLDQTIKVDEIRKCTSLKLFITATNVRTGNAHIFRNSEMETDVILASACLPFLFQAIEIKGEAYWDGGYVGNPALWPLFYETDTDDLCVIHINPIERKHIPKTPYDITNRINEISFNVPLMAELRAIEFVKKLIEDDWLKDKYKHAMRDIRLHAIRADHELKNYSVASKFQTDWLFLCDLRDAGRLAAEQWLKHNFDAIGKASTVDIKDDFLNYAPEKAA